MNIGRRNGDAVGERRSRRSAESFPRYRRSDILIVVEPAALIRSVRRRRGLTQAEFARLAGTSQPVVSAYEHGRRDPTFGTLQRLVAAGGERLLIDTAMLDDGPPPPVDDDERARRLVDVLLLADAIPAHRRSPVLRAPRLVSS